MSWFIWDVGDTHVVYGYCKWSRPCVGFVEAFGNWVNAMRGVEFRAGAIQFPIQLQLLSKLLAADSAVQIVS